MIHNVLTLSVVLLLIPAGCGGAEPALTLKPEEWRNDVRHFTTELPKRHVNPFEFTSRDEWLTEAAALERDIDEMNADDIVVALRRLASRIGDLHTQVELPSDRARLPYRVRRFNDEYRIVAVAAGNERAIGARLVSIDGVEMPTVLSRLREITPRGETDMLADALIARFLSVGMLLHGSRITRDRNHAKLGLISDEGVHFVLEMRASAVSPQSEWKHPFPSEPLWLAPARPAALVGKASGASAARTSRSAAHPPGREEPFWFVWIPEKEMIYVSFSAYGNLRSGSRALARAIERHAPKKIAIDMRRNSGGDYKDGLKYLVEPIRNMPSINRRNRLFVIIGPETFSAAMANAVHFRQRTEATLVGEAIGERPNSNQEPREFRLPSSKLIVSYSTRRYEFAKGAAENVIRPDHVIQLTWEAYRDGRDPVLEWIEGQP